MVKVVNLQGKLKSSKRTATELHFDFSINCIGKFFFLIYGAFRFWGIDATQKTDKLTEVLIKDVLK